MGQVGAAGAGSGGAEIRSRLAEALRAGVGQAVSRVATGAGYGFGARPGLCLSRSWAVICFNVSSVCQR